MHTYKMILRLLPWIYINLYCMFMATGFHYECNKINISRSVISDFSDVLSKKHVNLIRLHFAVRKPSLPRWLDNTKWYWIKNYAGQATLSLITDNIVSSMEDLRSTSIGTLTAGITTFDIKISVYKGWCQDLTYESTNIRVYDSRRIGMRLAKYLNSEQERTQRLCYGYNILDGTSKYECCQLNKIKQYDAEDRCNTKLHSLNSLINNIKIVTELTIFFLLPLLPTRIFQSHFIAGFNSFFANATDEAGADSQDDRTKFIKVTESPLGLSTLLGKLTWKGNKPWVSFLRRIIFYFGIFLPIILYFYPFNYLLYGTPFYFATLLHFFFCGFVATFVSLANENTFYIDQFESCVDGFLCLSGMSPRWFTRRIYSTYEASISIITSPFNFEKWKRRIIWCNKIMTCSSSRSGKITAAILTCFICILSFPLYFIFLWILVFIYISMLVTFHMCGLSMLRKPHQLIRIFFGVHLALGIIAVPVNCYLFIIQAGRRCLFIFLGIFFNFEYFMPYIIAFLAVIFYLWNLWGCLEREYFSLKMAIYGVCKNNFKPGVDRATIVDSENPLPAIFIMSGCACDEMNVILWKYNKNNIPLISKLLYKSVRKDYMPYDRNLFYFVLKCFAIIVFAFFAFGINSLLEHKDVSIIMRTLAMFCVSALPNVFNVFGWRQMDELTQLKKEIKLEQVEKTILRSRNIFQEQQKTNSAEKIRDGMFLTPISMQERFV